MEANELTALMRQFVARYRRALWIKLSVFAAASMAVVAALLWRLALTGARPAVSIGLPGLIAAALAGGYAWWARRAWMSNRATAAHLDRVLGLQQRLVTALECAQRADTSSLYPLLVEDTRSRFSAGSVSLPRPIDHSTGLLFVALILLLCWPGRGPTPLRLAGSLLNPQARQTPPPPPPTPDQQPQDQEQQRQQQQSSKSQQSSGAGQQEPSSSGSGGQQPPPKGSQQSRQGQGSSGASRSPEQGTSGKSGGSLHAEGTSGQGQGKGQQGQQDRQQAGGGGQQSARPSQGSQGGSQQQAGQTGAGEQGGAQEGSRSPAAQDSTRGAKPQQTAGQQAGATQQAQQPGGGQGSQPAPGAQQELKADIQELLKQVSGEVSQLQQELAQHEPPQPGTSSEPGNLYDAPEQIDPATGVPLDIQLKTDAFETKTERPGSGTGAAGTEAARAAPRMREQQAELSETPTEAASTARPAVPPEYQGVFEALNQRERQPSESP